MSQTNVDLGSIRVDEVSDAQFRRFVNEMDRLGLSNDQVEQVAIQRGMNPIEVVKLKERIALIRRQKNNLPGKAYPPDNQARKITDSISALEQKPIADFGTVFTELQSRNYGFEVFNNPRIVFEPSLSIPTPRNYLLAANDELLIDVSGNSEANYKLKISPEGVIRIPIAGPVNVSGLTIEQAQTRISKKLAGTIYSAIRTGKTKVDVSLGAIRSIRVTVIGEATMPGTYTLPSLASAFHALYACGGPNSKGSFRNIQVIRNSVVIAEIDVYNYLSTGIRKSDIRLMDQDVIKINTYTTRIELKGEVKRPGLFDVAKGEKMAKIIEFAGGYTDVAYTGKIQVYKNTASERKVTTINEDQLKNLVPDRGDTYIVGRILNRFTNRVNVNGAVYRPGDYELKEGMTLIGLINEAEGIREDAFLQRAIIHRLKKDLSPEITSIDLGKLLIGEIKDIELRREDRVMIYSKFDLKEGYFVTIDGEVSSPGVFLYEDSMKVMDLILMAGGLKESSSTKRVEISRRIKDTLTVKNSQSKTAIIFQQDIRLDLSDSSQLTTITLLPFDEIVVRAAPGYFVQKNVVIEGEVHYTGKYSLEAKNDRISDLIKRAGGITADAYLKGAVLVRTRNFSRTQQTNFEVGLKNLVKENLSAGTSVNLLQTQVTDMVERKSDFVGINLETILDNPHSEFDLFLNDGDTIRIPTKFQTVRVNGEVLYPTLVRYDERFKFKDYVLGAGGFNERSAKKRSYVLHPNGTVEGTRHFLFFKNYPSLSPGAEIFIPLRRERERLRTGEVITIGATLVSMLAILVTLIK